MGYNIQGAFAGAAAAAAGGNLVFVGQTVLGEDSGSISVTFTSIAQADVSEMVVIMDADMTVGGAAQNCQMRLNELTGTTYNTDGVRVNGGTEVITNEGGLSAWRIFNNNNNGERYVVAHILANRTSDTVQGWSHGSGIDGGEWSSLSNSATVTAYTDFTVFSNLGDNDFLSGSLLTVYRVNDS